MVLRHAGGLRAMLGSTGQDLSGSAPVSQKGVSP